MVSMASRSCVRNRREYNDLSPIVPMSLHKHNSFTSSKPVSFSSFRTLISSFRKPGEISMKLLRSQGDLELSPLSSPSPSSPPSLHSHPLSLKSENENPVSPGDVGGLGFCGSCGSVDGGRGIS